MQGSKAQINAGVSQAPVIYSRPFHWPPETGACGGGGGGGASGDDHCLCSARPPLEVKEHGGVGPQGLQT